MNEITTKQAAAVLGVTERRVRALIAAGRIYARKFSGAWAIPVSQLEKDTVMVRKPGRPRKEVPDGFISDCYEN